MQVNVKWAYCLIAVIYIMLIILKAINYKNLQAYRKSHPELFKVFSIKKDFFTTVSIVCILVTLAINSAALLGGRPLNISSMIVTCFVIGFTIINSFGAIYYTPSESSVFLLGYELDDIVIQSMKYKKRKNSYVLNLTFERDIDGYNYVKFVVYGKEAEGLVHLLEQCVENAEKQKSNEN